MPNTRSNCRPPASTKSTMPARRRGRVSVNCMSNPFEYTVTKTNTYKEERRNRSDAQL